MVYKEGHCGVFIQARYRGPSHAVSKAFEETREFLDGHYDDPQTRNDCSDDTKVVIYNPANTTYSAELHFKPKSLRWGNTTAAEIYLTISNNDTLFTKIGKDA